MSDEEKKRLSLGARLARMRDRADIRDMAVTASVRKLSVNRRADYKYNGCLAWNYPGMPNFEYSRVERT